MIKELLLEDFISRKENLPSRALKKIFNDQNVVTKSIDVADVEIPLIKDGLNKNYTSVDKFRVILDGLLEEHSIENICRNENISIETYGGWKSDFLKALDHYDEHNEFELEPLNQSKSIILKETNLDVYKFFSKFTSFNSNKNFVLPVEETLSSYSMFNNIENIVVLNKMNNFRQINKHLEGVNKQIPKDGLLFGNFETFTSVMKKNKLNGVPIVGKINSGLIFIFKRVAPKIKYINKLYFSLTKGKNRLLSKAEALGRLVSCGFDIVDLKVVDGVHYFVAKKVKAPDYNMNPSYGPLFKMNRVGKNGKIIGVYKFRTMHPYSEYLQEYVLKLNGYSETGKPADDFRVVPWAKFLRKYWIDELPQLINVLKGEMKLVGIRPVSMTYFKSIPQDIQEKRLTQKPGCIPPYVALNRKSSVESVLEAEKEYLVEKINNPYTTDIKYFFKAFSNIFFKGKRSA